VDPDPQVEIEHPVLTKVRIAPCISRAISTRASR
jgi:hypothetical protein